MSDNKKNSILIIDDDKSNIMVLTGILGKEYKVYALRDSREALETAEDDMPDVILLDVLMPEMDGYDVIAALKNSERTRDIPVIFITGLDSIEDEEKGLSLGASDYISKPFHSPIVRMRVQNQIKIIEQYRTIERISLHDQLTGLPNRRNFEARLNSEWSRAKRYGSPLSLLIIDIDKFKVYNDTYGHQQGDNALVAVASVFNAVLKRSSDFSARWGGEEFIALLSNTDAGGAMEVAENLRAMAESTGIPWGKTITNITLSIGVRTWLKEDEFSMDDFISGADEALYIAKNTGRNRVCMFTKS